MWNGECPNDIEVYGITDRTFDKISEYENVSTFYLIDLCDYDVWVCPRCKRLYVFDNNFDSNKVKCVYKLEE